MSVHVVFSAECNHAMTWQAAALFHSHRTSGQPGNITRLLACSDEQLQSYAGLDLGPTFVHPNMRLGHPLINETGYPSYNKPASVMFWLAANEIEEEFVALLDTDMLLREPLDPVALGARRGVVVSAEYGYLVGSEGLFAARWLDEEQRRLTARVGGFHIFHREDIRAIAPLWVRSRHGPLASRCLACSDARVPAPAQVQLTGEVRAFAHAEQQTYLEESFLNWRAVSQGGAAEVSRPRRIVQAQRVPRRHGAVAPRRRRRRRSRRCGRRRCTGAARESRARAPSLRASRLALRISRRRYVFAAARVGVSHVVRKVRRQTISSDANGPLLSIPAPAARQDTMLYRAA